MGLEALLSLAGGGLQGFSKRKRENELIQLEKAEKEEERQFRQKQADIQTALAFQQIFDLDPSVLRGVMEKVQAGQIGEAVGVAEGKRRTITEQEKFEEEKRQFNISTDIERQRIAASKLSKAKTPGELKVKLRGQIRQEPVFKDVKSIESAFQNVKVGTRQDNAAGDLAIVNGIAKMLDPTGVVRPSEFETVEESQGFFERMLNIKQKVAAGDRLLPEVRRRFETLADELFDEKVGSAREEITKIFGPIARQQGFDLEEIFPTIGLNKPLGEQIKEGVGVGRQPPPTPSQTPAPQGTPIDVIDKVIDTSLGLR